jgi:preprotein translocase subunit SecG
MATFLLVIHIIVSLCLVFIVLIQGGKGAEMGAVFGGGSSQTVFGSRGAATFLNKMTTIVAVVFMLSSLLLAIVSVKGTSVIKKTLPAAERPTTAPALPPDAPMPAQGQTPEIPPPAQ